MNNADHAIAIDVSTRFLEEPSVPADDRFVFAYTILVRNTGRLPAQLLERHWTVTDANGKVQEIHGEGVIGQQPWLWPGEDFRYTSGAVLETPLGTMQGHYLIQADDGTRFDAPIPAFILSIPRTLH